LRIFLTQLPRLASVFLRALTHSRLRDFHRKSWRDRNNKTLERMAGRFEDSLQLHYPTPLATRRLLAYVSRVNMHPNNQTRWPSVHFSFWPKKCVWAPSASAVKPLLHPGSHLPRGLMCYGADVEGAPILERAWAGVSSAPLQFMWQHSMPERSASEPTTAHSLTCANQANHYEFLLTANSPTDSVESQENELEESQLPFTLAGLNLGISPAFTKSSYNAIALKGTCRIRRVVALWRRYRPGCVSKSERRWADLENALKYGQRTGTEKEIVKMRWKAAGCKQWRGTWEWLWCGIQRTL